MLEIKNLYNELGSSIGCLCDYDKGYICDVISEIADNQVDIYYSDLRSWANGHFEEISETISEFGWDGCGNDLYKAVQMAQFRENESVAYSEIGLGLILPINVTEKEEKEKYVDYLEKLKEEYNR